MKESTDKDIKESKIINLLIPEAIKENNKVHKEVKNRIKLNKIFNEFENKASNELNYFINLSTQRYNSLKNGHHNLKNLILNSKRKNQYEVNKILKDPFYIDLNIEKEKEKMKIIKTKDLNKNIAPILSKIKQPEIIIIDNLCEDDKDNEDINYLENNIHPVNSYKEYINNIINNKKININKNNHSHYYSFNRKSNNINIKKNKVKFKFSKDLQPINKDITSISSLLKKEENMINRSFKNYKNILKTEGNISKKDITNNIIRLPRLKLLDYKSHKKINKNNDLKDPKKINVDYKYLLSFSNKSLYKNENASSTSKRLGNKSNRSSSQHTERNDTETYQIDNYGNTLNIVVNSAKKELDKENDLDYKRKQIENIFGIEDTPKVNFYDIIIKRKAETIKNERNIRARRIIEKQKILNGSNKDELNKKIEKNVKLLDKVFNNINNYNSKNH